ncbi:hypothetical protein A2U01_0028704 [Trifolium medium]|uniref:Uncharacterized protein n=1 Tax=Trifolium medium TaxID=97028 RepID=A0A392P9P9_9FABA|nr:hypothetical protein [Trifolium medium]
MLKFKLAKTNIDAWNKQIEDLKTKIRLEDSKKNDLADTAEKATKTQIEEEAKRGIQYVASSETIDPDIKALTESNNILDTKLIYIKGLYNKLKTNLRV